MFKALFLALPVLVWIAALLSVMLYHANLGH